MVDHVSSSTPVTTVELTRPFGLPTIEVYCAKLGRRESWCFAKTRTPRRMHQQMDFCPQHPAHHPQLGGSGDVDKPAPRRVDAEGCIPLGKCPHRVCGDSRKGAASPLLKLCDEDAVHARDVVRGACREDNNRVQDARDGVPRALAQKDDLTAASTFRRVIGRRHAPRVPLFADNRAPLHQNKITTVASRAIGMTLG